MFDEDLGSGVHIHIETLHFIGYTLTVLLSSCVYEMSMRHNESTARRFSAMAKLRQEPTNVPTAGLDQDRHDQCRLRPIL